MSSNSVVFFENVTTFPLIENDQIPTEQLLLAAESIVKFIEMLGMAFKPVRDDINGNVNKLRTVYRTNPEAFTTLNAILEDENKRIPNGKFKIASDALLWLTRALYYNELFLIDFFSDFKNCQNCQELSELPENLTHHFEKAYEASLKKHHNWMVQKIFGLCLRAVPYRSSLLMTLGYLDGQQKLDMNVQNKILATMEHYLNTLSSCNKALVALLDKHQFKV